MCFHLVSDLRKMIEYLAASCCIHDYFLNYVAAAGYQMIGDVFVAIAFFATSPFAFASF